MVVGCERERVIVLDQGGREELAIGGESGQLVLVCHTTCVHQCTLPVCHTTSVHQCAPPVCCTSVHCSGDKLVYRTRMCTTCVCLSAVCTNVSTTF